MKIKIRNTELQISKFCPDGEILISLSNDTRELRGVYLNKEHVEKIIEFLTEELNKELKK